jgi:hypothetical protein
MLKVGTVPNSEFLGVFWLSRENFIVTRNANWIHRSVKVTWRPESSQTESQSAGQPLLTRTFSSLC